MCLSPENPPHPINDVPDKSQQLKHPGSKTTSEDKALN